MDETIKGHRERLRSRFSAHGFDGFHDYEVLELLLTYAIPRIDVKPIAKRLLSTFGTLAGVFDATAAELSQTRGMGEKGAVFLTLIRQVEIRYLASGLPGKKVFDRPEKVKAHLRMLLQGRAWSVSVLYSLISSIDMWRPRFYLRGRWTALQSIHAT